MAAGWQERLASFGEVREGERMAEHTSFGVGGPAAFYVRPRTAEALAEAAAFLAHEDVPYLVLGKGSNLLVSDAGFDGVMLATDGLTALTVSGETLCADAGVSLHALAHAALEAGLEGLAFAAGIPGSVGGAVFMNAGAYGGEIRQVLSRALVCDREGKAFWQTPEELCLSYRHSRCMDDGLTVLRAEFSLTPGDREAIRAEMADLAARRREKQPLEYRSAGSTFKRPEGYFAGKLIEDAGLKGFCVGGAQVSEKHAGFVINRGGATASDIRQLCDVIRQTVMERFGVPLELEVRLVGRF